MERRRAAAAEERRGVKPKKTGACSTASLVLRTGAPWRDMPERYGLHDGLQSLQPLAQGGNLDRLMMHREATAATCR